MTVLNTIVAEQSEHVQGCRGRADCRGDKKDEALLKEIQA